MSAIAKVDNLPTLPPLGTPSPRLAHVMRYMEDGYNGFHIGPDWKTWFAERMPKRDIIDEAKGLLPAFEQALLPAGAVVIRDWLRPIAAAVNNPPTRADFEARAAAMALACASLPIAAFTHETQRDAIIAFKFWPSVSELHRLLEDDIAELRHRHASLVKVATVRPFAEFEAAREAALEASRWPSRGRQAWN